MIELNYTELKDKLFIEKHCLDDELQIQSSIQCMISEKLSKARQHMDLCENDLEKIEARLYVTKSEELINGKKPSVEYLKSAVKSDKERTAKWLDFNESRAEHERWEGLYYAWRSRNDALQGLAKLAVANYYAVESTFDRKERTRSSSRPVIRRRESNG
jgi:hypothetical protein